MFIIVDVETKSNIIFKTTNHGNAKNFWKKLFNKNNWVIVEKDNHFAETLKPKDMEEEVLFAELSEHLFHVGVMP